MAAPAAKTGVSNANAPQWSDHAIRAQLWRYAHFSPTEKEQTRQKVQAVSDYLFSRGLFLKGARADGNCFFHSLLSSYAEKQKKNKSLEQQNNKIKYLRMMVAKQMWKIDKIRAKAINEDRTWISSDEGGKLAPLLKFPIRVITANLDKNGVGVEDGVYKVNGVFQDWESISPKPSVQETPIIVDLGGHFIWASNDSPLPNLPQLSTSQFTVWHQQKSNHFSLDGTEENFREVLEAIARLKRVKGFTKRNSQDNLYSSDDEFVEEQSEYKSYMWKDNSSPSACRTTISCIDGNMKGNEILAQCRNYISQFLKHMDSEVNEDPTVCPARYFAANAGRFAKYKTSLDCSQKFSSGEYCFGLSQVRLELNKDERLIIVDEDLQNWITGELGLKIERWDLPYRGYDDVVGIQEIIGAIKDKVISYTAPEPRKVPDNELGTVQLYCAFPLSYPIGDGPHARLLEQGALHKFLDFLNALIFGVEGSRNNLVFLTGLLVLLDMRYGSYPTEKEQKGHYFYDDLFDLFPMAVTGTGSGNFIAEKAMYLATEQLEKNRHLLAGRRPLGFSSFRENPTWLKVALKSVILIYNWLANSEIIQFAAEEPIKTLEEQIEERLYEEIMHHYLRKYDD